MHHCEEIRSSKVGDSSPGGEVTRSIIYWLLPGVEGGAGWGRTAGTPGLGPSRHFGCMTGMR